MESTPPNPRMGASGEFCELGRNHATVDWTTAGRTVPTSLTAGVCCSLHGFTVSKASAAETSTLVNRTMGNLEASNQDKTEAEDVVFETRRENE